MIGQEGALAATACRSMLRAPEETAMPEVRFSVDTVRGVPVLTVPEESDVTNAPGLRVALLEAAADGAPVLVVDMTGTRYCDSAGLHVLVDAHKRARAEGREVLLAVAGAAVLRVLAITGIDLVIPNFSTLDEALEAAIKSVDGESRRRVDGGAEHGDHDWTDDASTARGDESG
jgi:anti-sigma B factor antagonist